MNIVVGKSVAFALLAVVVMYLSRSFLHTDAYLPDVGGLGAFVTVFGTLYGIMAAFVVFEVWNQYNRTSGLIDQEALGLERLFRLTLYFRDKKLTGEMKKAIKDYAGLVVKTNFKILATGQRNTESGKLFRKIAEVVKHIKFDDDHDAIVFDHVVSHYGHVSEVRTQRISQSLTRLPVLLKAFLYISSLFALLTFIIMPFTNVLMGAFATFALGFTISMIFQLVEDLDNPFVGHWNLSVEPFERALKHIEEDYS